MSGATIKEASVDIPQVVNDGNNAKADALAEVTSGGEGRPSWLPEGFGSVEDYVAAAEAAGVGVKPADVAPPKDDPKGEPEGASKETPEKEEPPVQTAEDVSKAVGFDIAPFASEFAEKGELSEESFKALADKGFPKEFVQSWIAGQQALVAGWTDQLAAEVGGKEAYEGLLRWASQSMSPEDYAAVGAQLSDAKNLKGAKLALKGLQAEFHAKEGREANLVGGTSSAAKSTDVFATREEQRKAMNDPRYRNSPQYRAGVEAKSLRSKFDAG